jgi:hypothetical protein
VEGLDPSFEYRWVKDVSEQGQRIYRFLAGGWEFSPKENLQVGQEAVFNSENLGSLIRVPGGRGEYLYLMRIPKEWYLEDQKAKADEVHQIERKAMRKRTNSDNDGDYGSGKISYSSSVDN